MEVELDATPHVLRARRTAAVARAGLALIGIVLLSAEPGLARHPLLSLIGFGVIGITSAIQIGKPLLSWLKIEEAVSCVAGLLIVGLGDERVNILALLWLSAVASGVLARGGRAHWLGRQLVVFSLLLPVLLTGRVELDYAAMAIAAIGLLFTCGRLTLELNVLLGKARWDADHDGLTGRALAQRVPGAARRPPGGRHVARGAPADRPRRLRADEQAARPRRRRRAPGRARSRH